MTTTKETRGFTSNLGAIVAAAGSAIGLGNIWRFPYTVGQNGGGAFLLLYILFVFFLGLPIMMSEFVIGRRSQRNTVGAFRQLGPQYRRWTFVGVLGIVAAFLIYSFYSTVAGWTLNYVFLSGSGQLSGRTPEEVSQVFATFTSGTAAPLLCQLGFILLTAVVVLFGVQKGIEKCTKVLMPLLLVLMLLLCVRSLTLKGSSAGLAFLFEPDFSKLTWGSVLSALGQALFSLSIGMGALVTYGSYIRKEDNLFKTGVCVAGADTLIALLSGIAIFPAVFAFGMSPASGPSLVYEVLPVECVRQHADGGAFCRALFPAALHSGADLHHFAFGDCGALGGGGAAPEAGDRHFPGLPAGFCAGNRLHALLRAVRRPAYFGQNLL